MTGASAGRAFVGAADPIHVHVGQRLRTLRKASGLTQAELGAAVGVTLQQIQKYEAGKNRISATMLYGVARRLATPVGAFFEGLPDPALREPGFAKSDPKQELLAKLDR